jgi:CRP-like cAMP-binding protein
MTDMLLWGASAVDGAGDALGALGLALYIGSYLALQIGVIRGDGYAFAVLNLAAAAAVLGSLLEAFNLYAALGEIAWIAISLIGIVRLFVLQRFLRLTPAESAVARTLAPGLPRHRARSLLRLGEWRNLKPGQALATQGVPVHALMVVTEGNCQIVHDGRAVAVIGPGAVIGEITLATGGPATATVEATTPVRLLWLDRGRLLGFLRRNEDVEHALERAMADDMRSKLAQTTRALAMGAEGSAPNAPRPLGLQTRA